jgi:hypothetical protein
MGGRNQIVNSGNALRERVQSGPERLIAPIAVRSPYHARSPGRLVVSPGRTPGARRMPARGKSPYQLDSRQVFYASHDRVRWLRRILGTSGSYCVGLRVRAAEAHRPSEVKQPSVCELAHHAISQVPPVLSSNLRPGCRCYLIPSPGEGPADKLWADAKTLRGEFSSPPRAYQPRRPS